MEPPLAGAEPSHYRGQELLAALGAGGARFFDSVLPVGVTDRAEYVAALWDLVWAGSGHLRHVRPRARAGRRRRRAPQAEPAGGAHPPRPAQRSGAAAPDPGAAARRRRPRPAGGRWSSASPSTPAEQLAGHVFGLLDRYGVVTRGTVMTENTDGGFGAAYRAMSTMEETGQCRRGYFIDGLGAAQFALSGAVDRLRAQQREPEEPTATVLAACDPANAYGAALPWPEREGHRPGRKAGALVVLVDGALVFYVERGGKTLLSFTEEERRLRSCGRTPSRRRCTRVTWAS